MSQEKITIFPTYYFYPISWHGITDSDYHLKNKINEHSFFSIWLYNKSF
jgi:hypothetical protein